MQVQPYLFFEGRCEEAIEFYRKAVGAKVEMLMRYKDSPEPPPPGCAPSDTNKVMHASLQVGNTTVMASDGQANGKPSFQGFALSLDAQDQADAKRLFGGLSDGGNVLQPLTKTFFSPCFGMVQDRFGVMWMVIVVSPEHKG